MTQKPSFNLSVNSKPDHPPGRGGFFESARLISDILEYVDERLRKYREGYNTRRHVFSANFHRRKTNPFVYIKFWKQVYLPSLLFGVELFSLNKSLLEKLERCQHWFLKILFYVPDFCASSFLLQIVGLFFC